MAVLKVFDVYNAVAADTLDIGTVAPSSSDDTLLRLFNSSDLFQAEDVTVSLDGPNEGQLYLSTDGENFTASITVGDIPPGAYSAVFTLRRVSHQMVQNGPYTADLVATPASWGSLSDTGSSTNIPLDTSDS